MAQGGPGGSTINTYATYLIDDAAKRPTANRNIVLWDQRGTLYSKPALMCPEVGEADLEMAKRHTGVAEARSTTFKAYKSCGARLATDVGDLSAFNSAENANDIEALRIALGYDAINFYGVSYGTELGQFLMRRHPEHLRSVILDAVVPLSYSLFTEPAFAKQRIGEKYLLGCAEQPTCDAAFPHLSSRYLALIDRLNAQPVPVMVTVDETAASSIMQLLFPQTQKIILTGDLLEDAIYQSLYMDVHDVIPLMVDRADKGDYTYVSSLILPLLLFNKDMADGMWVTVVCAERGDTNPDAAVFPGILPRLVTSTREDAHMLVAVCRDWKVELLPRADLEPLSSTIPTLMLSGDFDPITPPGYAASLLPQLPNGKHVIFPSGSHGQAVTSECTNRIIQAFLDTPLDAVDSSCVSGAVRNFTTSSDVIFLATVQYMMAKSGIIGWLLPLLVQVPALLCALFLLTAALVYPTGALLRLIFRRPLAYAAGTAGRLSRAAPWLAVVAPLVILTFIIGIALAVRSAYLADQNLIAMGAIPSRWRWLFPLPPALAVIAGLMTAAMIALWTRRQRSLSGRLYFTLLTLAALIATVSLFWIA
jgi:pimeloyl-ACP methyl ester carboxylesterase